MNTKSKIFPLQTDQKGVFHPNLSQLVTQKFRTA